MLPMETTLRILVSDLTTVRIVCQGKNGDGSPCGKIVEMPVALLQTLTPNVTAECKFCGQKFSPNQNVSSPLWVLADSLAALRQAENSSKFSVEFVIPAGDLPPVSGG